MKVTYDQALDAAYISIGREWHPVVLSEWRPVALDLSR